MRDNDYDPQLESIVGNHSPSAATQAADALRAASQRVHSLAVAFLLGIVVARRR
jgi:hypothetical protein